MTIRLQLHPQTKIESARPSLIALEHPRAKIRYPNPSEALYACLVKLISPGAPLNDLVALWERESEPNSAVHLFFILEELNQHRFLSCSATHGGELIATLHPFLGFPWNGFKGRGKKNGQLSRFAYLRREGETFLLESPLSFGKLELFHSSCLEILMRLSKPTPIEAFDHLAGACAFVELLDRGNFLEEENPSLKIWEFHDLLFHSRSRKGRHDYPLGGTFRFLGEMPPFLAVRPLEGETLIPLAKADLETLKKKEAPFSKVLEERRSLREYGNKPITLQQLGEFLSRSAQIRRASCNSRYETLFRTAPGGGACHPIEIYPLVARCDGLEPGLYRYHRLEHGLSLVSPLSEPLRELLRFPEKMLENGESVQVLLIFAARFGRIMWKYESISYATILKDVGALMQTMYLVATAMGLAPCANGVGDSDLFAKASGLDYFVEGAVGEFVLGSKK